MPTLLARIPDINASAEMAAQAAGEDLLSGKFTRRWAFSMRSSQPDRATKRGTWGVATPKWRFRMDSRGNAALFNGRRDPLEQHDVAHKRPKVVERLTGIINRVLEDRPHVVQPTETKAEGAEEELRHELQLLGYLD
jgi:hypothetical protein